MPAVFRNRDLPVTHSFETFSLFSQRPDQVLFVSQPGLCLRVSVMTISRPTNPNDADKTPIRVEIVVRMRPAHLQQRSKSILEYILQCRLWTLAFFFLLFFLDPPRQSFTPTRFTQTRAAAPICRPVDVQCKAIARSQVVYSDCVLVH